MNLEKIMDNEKCDLISSTDFVRNILHSKKKSAIYY
jgi:hypothetical protein